MNRIGMRPQRSQKNSENSVNSLKSTSPLVLPLLNWFSTNARDLPWRRTRDAYAVWVSEIMLQQTQVKTVIPYWERWMRELPDVEALASASSEKIHKLWEGLGYYTRVRNMQKAARVVMEQHGGRFPTDYNAVLALPGIGRYTGGAICSIAFNQPTPILDGNVIRVLARVFGLRENVREKKVNARLWLLAEQFVNAAASLERRPVTRSNDGTFGHCSALNQSLMELGALICTPRQPRCDACPLADGCVARKMGQAESLPNLGERKKATARRFIACVVERDGAVFVRQRPAGVVNGHLWEFPNVEVALKASPNAARKTLEAGMQCQFQEIKPLVTVKHSITRYRITLNAFRATLNGTLPARGTGEWIPADDLARLAFTSAHRRVWEAARQQAGRTL